MPRGTPSPSPLPHGYPSLTSGPIRIAPDRPNSRRSIPLAEPGVVGAASVGADLEFPAGYALRTGKPVISNHLENEQRFRTPDLLVKHGIHRAMNVILQGDGSPLGVLEVDSKSEGKFGERDIAARCRKHPRDGD